MDYESGTWITAHTFSCQMVKFCVYKDLIKVDAVSVSTDGTLLAGGKMVHVCQDKLAKWDKEIKHISNIFCGN